MRWLAVVARFWCDFVVGDSVILAIGGVAVLGTGAILVAAGAGSLTQVALPMAMAVTLALSLRPPR